MAGELILIVEDNEKNQKLLRDVLQVRGYRTVETVTAEEGIEVARAQQPTLILMDIQLPGMDGMAALRELRADGSTQRIPVIAVTASAMPMERREILAAGFDEYITKPLSVRELTETVKRFVDAAPDDASGSSGGAA